MIMITSTTAMTMTRMTKDIMDITVSDKVNDHSHIQHESVTLYLIIL